MGIRPEDRGDAALVPSANGNSLPVRVTLAEALGSEVIAHFPLGGVETTAADVASDPPSSEGAPASGALLTARLSPKSSARTGQPLRVVIDLERLHFFDPETDDTIA